MGLLATRWEATYEGHKLVVARNELTRGFYLAWDGTEIASRHWSFIGVGVLHASAETGGRHVEVRVALTWGEACIITIDGKEIPVGHIT